MSHHVACDNPFRPVDWRWQRAVNILGGLGPPVTRRRDTPIGFSWIRKACRFKRAMDRAQGDNGELALVAERFPDLYWAYYLARMSNDTSRQSVEAHLLARETDYDIGYRCGLSPKVVEAYEAVFFNVREKLVHPKYITHVVLGPSIQKGFSERDYGVLWKLYGYFLGPHVLDTLEHKFVNPQWCGTADGANAAWQDDTINTFKMKCGLAAKTVGVDYHTQLALLEQFTKFIEVERTTDSAGKAQQQILDHIEALFGNLPFSIGGRDPRKDKGLGKSAPTPLDGYREASVELTYEETIRIGVGQAAPELDELMHLEFPPTPQPGLAMLSGPEPADPMGDDDSGV